MKEIEENLIFHDPMAVTWLAKYDKQFSRFWSFLPDFVAKILTTCAIFFLGISINGDWINLWTHFNRQFSASRMKYLNNSSTSEFLEYLKLKNFSNFWIPSVLVSYSMFFFVGGFIHWYYYIHQRDKAEIWKCQPNKWLTPKLARNEIFVGSTTLIFSSTFSALLACYIANDGYSTVYYQLDKFGWFWFFLSFPVIFITQDLMVYAIHRLLHTRFFYINFHKLHHRYKTPTPFSVTAIHPVEALCIQAMLAIPLFLVPVHWSVFYSCSIYAYYHGILDHSGVNFQAYWWQPWQPDAIFHDNHHQYFHVNFGFNMSVWDKFFGTYRREDRIYNEDIFGGSGKSLDAATTKELENYVDETHEENHLAHRPENAPFHAINAEINKLKKFNHNNK